MTEALRTQLGALASRHGWDAGALYAIVSLETGRTFALDAGAESWTPTRTAIGFLQFTEGTARALGVPATPHPPRLELAGYGGAWRTWTIAHMGTDQQLELVERFYERAFERKQPKRPVDYYLATWGAAPGLPDATVLASKGERIYALNKILDRNADEKIQVLDLRLAVSSEMNRTRAEQPPTPVGDVFWTLLVMTLCRRALP